MDYSDFKLYDDGIPKHRKKKKKKTKKKSNHKHIYDLEVLFREKGYFQGYRYHYSNVCSICGEIGIEKIFETKKDGIYYIVLSQEEVMEKYKDLYVVGDR